MKRSSLIAGVAISIWPSRYPRASFFSKVLREIFILKGYPDHHILGNKTSAPFTRISIVSDGKTSLNNGNAQTFETLAAPPLCHNWGGPHGGRIRTRGR